MSLTAIKRIVKPFVLRLDAWALAVCTRFPYFANLYYCLSRDFEREHHAVVVGRRRYYQSVGGASDLAHVYRLRRNTHRLEKGLISRPRREVFARDYITETLDSFVSLYSQESCSQGDELYSWSSSVLGSYFDAIDKGANECVDSNRRRYEEVVNACKERDAAQGDERSPFLRDTSPLRTTIDDMLDLAVRRRSVRWYEQKPVPREAIDRAITVAGYSPSACNRQPFEFRIFDDPAMVEKLSAIPMGTRGFNHQFPVFVVLVGKLHAYPFARDRHVIYIDTSLAAMAFEFALEVQGIASCSINWPDIPALEKKMAKLIGLEPDERVIMCMSLGYPDTTGLVPYSQKKPLDEIRSYNQMREE